MFEIVDVSRALDSLLGPSLRRPEDPFVQGARRWWRGPLDVEGLAASGVGLALRAAEAVARTRGHAVRTGATADDVGAAFGSIGHLRVDGREPQGFAPMSGFFETADGWIRLHANYPHHAEVVTEVLGVEDRSGLVHALRRRESLETEERIRAAGGVAGAVRTAEEWRSSEAGRAVDADPWIRLTDGDPRGARPLPAGGGLPLVGLRVLDLTRVIAGPTGSALLAALGADVLRVDPPRPAELLDQYLDTGAGKRSAVADLRDAATLARVHELAAGADVLLTGYRPGSLVTRELGAETVRERHPHLVHVGLSAWGDQGPWHDQRGFDSVVQAVTGIGHAYGGEDVHDHWRPGALPVQALDHATGYGMAAAAMALLAVRPERGGGSAALSLARTAHALLDAPPPPAERPREPQVTTVVVPSPHGVLERVRPPVRLDGVQVEPAAPGAYGSADLAWASARLVG